MPAGTAQPNSQAFGRLRSVILLRLPCGVYLREEIARAISKHAVGVFPLAFFLGEVGNAVHQCGQLFQVFHDQGRFIEKIGVVHRPHDF